MSQLVETSRTAGRPAPPEILVFPTDPRYDEARRAWNLAVDQRPPVVALPRTTAEVQAVVDYARQLDLGLAVQGTGHGAAARGDLSATVLVNTVGLTGVEVDPEARVARVRAGTIWADVVEAAVPHGLTALHGSAPDVGVVGYALGGGIGWLARAYGLAASSVVSAEVVTSDGQVVRASADENPELLWALKGGGGSFGIVTELEVRLVPLTEVYAGWLVWPVDRAVEVLGAWAEWTRAAPETVTSVGRVLQLPPLPDLPEVLRGRQLVVVEAAYLGDEESGRALLQPLRDLDPELDTFATVPARALTELHRDPPQPVPGAGDGWLLGAFDAEAAAALVGVAGMDGTSPLLSVEVRHLDGAVGRPAPDGGALDRIDAPYALYAVGALMGPVTRGAVVERIDDLSWSLAPWSTGRSYLNFAERRVDPTDLYGEHVAARLAEVRAQYDPDRRMRANHPVG